MRTNRHVPNNTRRGFAETTIAKKYKIKSKLSTEEKSNLEARFKSKMESHIKYSSKDECKCKDRSWPRS